jgi:hypothetical protein
MPVPLLGLVVLAPRPGLGLGLWLVLVPLMPGF